MPNLMQPYDLANVNGKGGGFGVSGDAAQRRLRKVRFLLIAGEE
jgi:hypothetical protein